MYIATSQGLAESLPRWHQADPLALDTEFIRVDTFFPRLGLIQLGDGRGEALLDPLAVRDLSPLSGPQAQALMLKLAQYPGMLTAAAQDFAPHDVTFYLRELASLYHSYYDAERILVDDETIRKARLALVAATAQVLHNGLQVLGVSAPTKM